MATIHMVRSVKGGSGKTAFALRTVVSTCQEKNRDKFKKVLYIDADVHASETHTMLFNKFNSNYEHARNKAFFFDFVMEDIAKKRGDIVGNLGEPDEEVHFLNTYIHPYKGFYSKLEDILRTANLKQVQELFGTDKKWELKKTESEAISFIFSDPSEDGRDVFGNIFQSSGRSAVGVGSYVAKMKNLLNYVLDECRGFTDIVVDMPPGSDTFSEHFANLLIETAGFNHTLNIYYVTNDDKGHIISSVNAATAHLHQMKNAYIDDICLVCNKGRESEDSKDTVFDTERNELINRLNLICKKGIFELDRLSYKLFYKDMLYYESHRFHISKDGSFLPNSPQVFFEESKNRVIDLMK